MKYPLAFFILALLFVIPVLADYNYWTQAGNTDRNTYDVLGSSTNNYTLITAPAADFGSRIQPLVFDTNNDDTNEIFVYSGDNVVSLLNGDDPTQELGSILLGDFDINPVLCDIDTDGQLEYVGVFNNGTRFLSFIEIDANDSITVGTPLDLGANATNQFGRMACDPFYSPAGDGSNYVLFVDSLKNLHIATYTGGSWAHEIVDVDDAVDHEANDDLDFAAGDNDVIVSDDFNVRGGRSAIFIAGTHIHEYVSLGSTTEENSYDFFGDLSIVVGREPTQIFLALIDTGGARYRAIISTHGISQAAAALVDSDLISFRSIGNSLGSQLSIEDQEIVSVGISGAGSSTKVARHAVADIVGSTAEDIIMYWEYDDDQGDTGRVEGLRVHTGNNLSPYLSFDFNTVGTDPRACTEDYDVVGYEKIYAVDMNDDNNKDILITCERDTGAENQHQAFFLNAPFYYPNASVNVSLGAVTGVQATPSPVDYNRDGILDLIYSDVTDTFFLQSSTTTATANNYPFNIEDEGAVNESGQIISTTLATVEFPPEQDDYIYNFAAVCDVQTSTAWYEDLRTGYNASENDVSANFFPIEDFLTFNGLTFTIGGNYTSFLLTKFHSEGVRASMTQGNGFSLDTNRTIDVLSFADDGQVTSYWRFNKTETNLTIQKVVPFQGIVTLGSTTVANGENNYEIKYTPEFDSFSGQEYFVAEFLINNVTVTETSTAQFDGTNIQDVQVYTEGNGTFTMKYFGLSVTGDLEPEFVQFQNGQEVVVSGVTITFPAPSDSIVGEGFTVIPGFNEEFSYECIYDTPGTYRQRAYLAEPNTAGDYSNYEEITVVIPESILPDVTGDGTDFEDDETLGLIDAFLDSLGLNTAFAKFIIAWVIILFLLFLGTTFHPMAGVIAFLVGLVIFVAMGWIPFWIVIVLVILAAALLAMTFRKVFAGD